MLTDGLKLMLVGLSMVFIFLAFMILIINGISKILQPIIRRMDAAEAQKKAQSTPIGVVAGAKQEDKALTAAIMTAVYRYRANRRKKNK